MSVTLGEPGTFTAVLAIGFGLLAVVAFLGGIQGWRHHRRMRGRLAVWSDRRGGPKTSSRIPSDRIASLFALVGRPLSGRRGSRWRRAFEESFPDALEVLARSLRAGHVLPAALRSAARSGRQPAAAELGRLAREIYHGAPLREALDRMVDRVGTVDVRLFVTAVGLQEEAGGDLAAHLTKLAGLIRDRFRFRREHRIRTTQGRWTAYILGFLPVVLGLILYVVAPEHVSVLFEDPLGRVLLMGALVLQAAGFLIIRRIVEVEP